MSELKTKTKKALIWSTLDKGGQQLVAVLTGIFTARLLSEDDFGIMAVLVIFPALANILSDGGLTVALVRKTDAGEDDYNSMFWFNLVIGVTLYGVLWFAAPYIPRLYEDPDPLLLPVSRWLFLTSIVYATGLIQTTLLIKRMDFKKLGIANVVSLVFSGATAITMAYMGYGVWALVAQQLVLSVTKTVLFWFFGGWRPAFRFSFSSFRELFGYSSKLIVGSLVNTVSMHIYAPILRRFYSSDQVGIYYQANKMKEMGSSMIWTAFGLSTYSMMANLQHDHQRLKHAMRKTIRTVAFVAFPAMLGLAVVARPLVVVLITDRWLPAVEFIYPLCVGAIFFVLNYINANVVKVCGRSGLSLRMDILTAVMLVTFLLLTVRYGILTALIADAVAKMIVFFCYMGVNSRLMGYRMAEQLKDIFPYAVLGLSMAAVIYPLGWLISDNVVLVVAQVILGAGFYTGVSRMTGSKIITEVFGMVRNALPGKKYNG